MQSNYKSVGNLLTDKTLDNLREALNAYYNEALKRVFPKAARNTAINRLTAELEEFITNWEEAKI